MTDSNISGLSIDKMSLTRRSLLGGAAGLTFAGMATKLGFAADKLPLNFAHLPIIPATNLIVAAQMGFLEDVGIAPKRAVLGTYDIMRAALISDEINITFMVTDALIRARATGFDWKMLYPADIYFNDRADCALMIKKGSSIKSAKDLEGKTVMAAPGTISGSVFQSYMRSEGADDTSVRLINIPHSQVLAALESEQVAAAHMVDPFMTMGMAQGLVEVLNKHMDQVSPRFLISGYIAKGEWIDANPDLVQKFTDGLKAATDFINEKPDEVVPVLSKETKIPEEDLRKFFPEHYVIDSSITRDELQPCIDFLERTGEISSKVTLEELLAPSFPLQA